MSGMVKQSRLRPVLQGEATGIAWNNGYPNGWTGNTDQLNAWESLTSYRSGSAYARALNEGASVVSEGTLDVSRAVSGDTGHPYDHSFERWNTANPRGNFNYGRYTYRGPVFVVPHDSSSALNYARPWNISDAALRSVGTGLVNQASPLKSQANVLQAVLEIMRDGLPSALFSAITKPGSANKRTLIRAAGSDYLNHMFGFAPLVRDLAKLLTAVESIDKLVSQLIRDSGAKVHRKRDTPEVETDTQYARETVRDLTLMIPSGVSRQPMVSSNGYWVQSQYHAQEMSLRSTRHVWFSGSFSYDVENLRMPTFVSEFFDTLQGGKEPIRDVVAKYLLGAGEGNIADSLWWELTPFSWLVDWFVNAGVVLDNRRMFDRLGLVMDYGYVMCEETRTRTVTTTVNNDRGGAPTVYSSQRQEIRQRRVRASPFGFGIDNSALSEYQLSILGALATQGIKKP